MALGTALGAARLLNMQEGDVSREEGKLPEGRACRGLGLGDRPGGVEGAMPRWEGYCVAGHSGASQVAAVGKATLLESTDWDANFAAAAMWHLKQWRNRINSEGPASLDTRGTGLQLWFSSAPFPFGHLGRTSPPLSGLPHTSWCHHLEGESAEQQGIGLTNCWALRGMKQ